VSGLQEVNVPPGQSSSTESWRCYTRQFDDLNFGDARLEDIRYYFRNGRLHRVVLRAVPGQFENLKRTLAQRHGAGETKPGFADQWWWGFTPGSGAQQRMATIHLSKSFEETGLTPASDAIETQP
jgi:hypothetical protein